MQSTEQLNTFKQFLHFQMSNNQLVDLALDNSNFSKFVSIHFFTQLFLLQGYSPNYGNQLVKFMY